MVLILNFSNCKSSSSERELKGFYAELENLLYRDVKCGTNFSSSDTIEANKIEMINYLISKLDSKDKVRLLNFRGRNPLISELPPPKELYIGIRAICLIDYFITHEVTEVSTSVYCSCIFEVLNQNQEQITYIDLINLKKELEVWFSANQGRSNSDLSAEWKMYSEQRFCY
ncbi:MAG: hypothetical protein ACK4WD_05145 [Flavobacteriales bacterium]